MSAGESPVRPLFLVTDENEAEIARRSAGKLGAATDRLADARFEAEVARRLAAASERLRDTFDTIVCEAGFDDVAVVLDFPFVLVSAACRTCGGTHRVVRLSESVTTSHAEHMLGIADDLAESVCSIALGPAGMPVP